MTLICFISALAFKVRTSFNERGLGLGIMQGIIFGFYKLHGKPRSFGGFIDLHHEEQVLQNGQDSFLFLGLHRMLRIGTAAGLTDVTTC
jgi:hypothetical protein